MWNATKVAGEARKTDDILRGQELIDLIDQISDKFWATAKCPGAGVYARKAPGCFRRIGGAR